MRHHRRYLDSLRSGPRARAFIACRTVPGIGPGGWQSGALARAQVQHAERQRIGAILDTLTGRENQRRYGK